MSRITVNLPKSLNQQITTISHQLKLSKSKVVLLKLESTKGIPRVRLNQVKAQSLYSLTAFHNVYSLLIIALSDTKLDNNDLHNQLLNVMKLMKQIRNKMAKL